MKCFSESNSNVQKVISEKLDSSGIDSNEIGNCSIAKTYWYKVNSELDVNLDFPEMGNKNLTFNSHFLYVGNSLKRYGFTSMLGLVRRCKFFKL